MIRFTPCFIAMCVSVAVGRALKEEDRVSESILYYAHAAASLTAYHTLSPTDRLYRYCFELLSSDF